MHIKNIASSETIHIYNYFYPGLNKIVVIKGKVIIATNYKGEIKDSKLTIDLMESLPIENNIINQISSYVGEDDVKVIATLSGKISRELRKNLPNNFWYSLGEDEESWYKKKEIINFRQAISNYEVSDIILKAIPQYLRVEGEEIKSLIALVKTIEYFFRAKRYRQYLRNEVKKIK